MIDIAYLNDPDVCDRDYHSTSLGNLKETQPTRISEIDSEFVKFCPSIKTLYANTFEVKCPFDLEWTVEHNAEGGFVWNINTDKTTIDLHTFDGNQILQFTPDGRIVQIFPNPGWSFISDTPNVICLQHSNGITTNPPIISGQMDIYKWPDRQLSVGYYINNRRSQTFTLKKGQPWYRLSFITPDFVPVRLVRMYERCAFLKNTKNKSKLPTIRKLDWRRVFNYFGETRPKRLINTID